MKRINIFLIITVFFGFFTLNTAGISDREIAENMLIGDHPFGVQFIWDGYGTCTIKKEADVLKISGSQYSKDKEDFVFINGTVNIIDSRVFAVTGTLDTNIKSCCGSVKKEGTFTFKRWGNRKFWRLQNPERESFCDKYVCHYYIDIFMKKRD